MFGIAFECRAGPLRAGASAVDITPTSFPIRTNGGFTEHIAIRAIDRLHSRALVLDDGQRQLALVVVDSCMLPRNLIDEAKAMASVDTGLATDHILVSATHTHSAPAVMGCHGTDPEPEYREQLLGGVVESLARATRNLAPARIGWGHAECPNWVFCRRWIMQPGTAWSEPFTGRDGNQAQMNPGYDNADKVRKTGPVDPAVTVLSVLHADGRPLALYANYSTHYAGSSEVSADYFGEFARIVEHRLGGVGDSPRFVAMISNGTSGDANCLDFSLQKRRVFDHFEVARDIAYKALSAHAGIEHYSDLTLDALETTLTLSVRLPKPEEVVAASAYLEETVKQRPVRTVAENYARETVLLSRLPPSRELKLQAFRLGDLALTAIPCEVYGSTGLALKTASPFALTMNVSLANGAEGYVPPLEQFELGGYTTWRARTSCLEVTAESKIRAAIVKLLGQLAERTTSRE